MAVGGGCISTMVSCVFVVLWNCQSMIRCFEFGRLGTGEGPVFDWCSRYTDGSVEQAGNLPTSSDRNLLQLE